MPTGIELEFPKASDSVHKSLIFATSGLKPARNLTIWDSCIWSVQTPASIRPGEQKRGGGVPSLVTRP
jgi:hypothetical protein